MAEVEDAIRQLLKQMFKEDPDSEEKIDLSIKIWREAAERYEGKPGSVLCDDLLCGLFALNHIIFTMYPQWENDFKKIIDVIREDINSVKSEKDAVMLMVRAALTLFHNLFLMELGKNKRSNDSQLPYIW